MQRVSFVDPEQNELENDICFHNMKIADKFLNLEYFIASATSWIGLNPTKNFQDLEKLLRDNNLNTHLIAKNPKMQNTKLKLHNDIDCMYELIYSCKPKEYAIKELLETYSSYEENFANLPKAGVLVVDNLDDNKDPHIKIFSDEQKELLEQIKSNKKKLQVTIITAEQYLDELHEFCETTYKKKPEDKIVGMNKNGGPVFGLFVGKQLISDTGFTVTMNSENQPIVSLFDLRTLG